MPKVYKYIQLNDCEKTGRFENTLLTNEIWLSKYNQLNDPMEGIYYTFSGKDATRFLLSEKNKYLIGCFGSSPDNFSLWAYYANGFRGACIEIELNKDIEPHKISDCPKTPNPEPRTPLVRRGGNPEPLTLNNPPNQRPSAEISYV